MFTGFLQSLQASTRTLTASFQILTNSSLTITFTHNSTVKKNQQLKQRHSTDYNKWISIDSSRNRIQSRQAAHCISSVGLKPELQCGGTSSTNTSGRQREASGSNVNRATCDPVLSLVHADTEIGHKLLLPNPCAGLLIVHDNLHISLSTLTGINFAARSASLNNTQRTRNERFAFATTLLYIQQDICIRNNFVVYTRHLYP
jgi:hypothetical protein